MFGKTAFNRTPFNVSGNGEGSLYATVTSEYGVRIQPVRVLVMLGPVTASAEAGMQAGTLWLLVPLPATEAAAEYAVVPDMTALCPISGATFAAEFGMEARLAGRIPIDAVTIAAQFSVLPVLWAKLPLIPAALRAEAAVSANLSALVPRPALMPGAILSLRGALWAKGPLAGANMVSVFNTSAKALRTSESEEMVLEGLNLRPGQTLIIDTDTLEIEVDSVVRVDCWVTGGSFFQFKNGGNTLSFSDNAARRNLRVTVLWADRYL